MPRLANINIPDNKRIIIALTYIYGIGLPTAKKIIQATKIDENIRAKDLTSEQLEKLKTEIEKYKIEGEAKIEVTTNIRRIQAIGTYRGQRHLKRLPVRGQRTKTNARSKRGKKMTVGSGRKRSLEKT
ncbi:MAG: small subunit ribosomal protein S13 [Candidatus Berkelbacteria bacterium Licking1014_2]|uniref:Small ribosomal subunit protein uS13 n=1 Tax=Candidatus Berkelbacteria bacterium Licking1014_2 TaxID=2017146 RepID=A0A554LWH1_9BACT|nr:MAG: small subunit ribosomal protein S13 [Candidatus Berkelbacteria bacterium Licking1014_2]